jgi:hypothetical protein
MLNRLGPFWFGIYGLIFGDFGCGLAEWVCPLDPCGYRLRSKFYGLFLGKTGWEF